MRTLSAGRAAGDRLAASFHQQTARHLAHRTRTSTSLPQADPLRVQCLLRGPDHDHNHPNDSRNVSMMPSVHALPEHRLPPTLSAEGFVVPLDEPDRFLIYAPLRRAAFIATHVSDLVRAPRSCWHRRHAAADHNPGLHTIGSQPRRHPLPTVTTVGHSRLVD